MKQMTEDGFSLIELIMAIALLGLILGALPSALTNMTRNAADSEVQTIASFLAREKMEEIVVRKSVPREVGYSLIVNEPSTAFAPAGSVFASYNFTITTQWLNYNGTALTSSVSDVGYKQVTVTVTGGNAAVVQTLVIGDYGE